MAKQNKPGGNLPQGEDAPLQSDNIQQESTPVEGNVNDIPAADPVQEQVADVPVESPVPEVISEAQADSAEPIPATSQEEPVVSPEVPTQDIPSDEVPEVVTTTSDEQPEQAPVVDPIPETPTPEEAMSETQNAEPELQMPSVGRIIHFFPQQNDWHARSNYANFIPAIVVQCWGDDNVNLRIFPVVEEGDEILIRWSVPHKSKKISEAEDQAYWEWPPRI